LGWDANRFWEIQFGTWDSSFPSINISNMYHIQVQLICHLVM